MSKVFSYIGIAMNAFFALNARSPISFFLSFFLRFSRASLCTSPLANASRTKRSRQCSSTEAVPGKSTDQNRTPNRSAPTTTGKMNGGPSGFNNAPVTRSFIVASAIFTVFSGIQGRSHKLGLSYQDVYQKVNFWKIVESAFAFSSTPELMFGLYMLYYFRVFERQIGSNKYSVFILFSSVTSILCEVLALALLKDTSLKFTPGPYGLIFASFIPFYLDIPVSTKIRVFGVQFSDKSFIYLAGLQLLLSSWKISIFPGICGFVAGSLYRLNFFYIRKAKFPEFFSSFFVRLSWPSIGSMPATSTRNVMGSMPSRAVRPIDPNYPAPAPSTQEPSEASIATLVSMGFDQSSARQALIQARNDVNVATNILLESQSQ